MARKISVKSHLRRQHRNGKTYWVQNHVRKGKVSQKDPPITTSSNFSGLREGLKNQLDSTWISTRSVEEDGFFESIFKKKTNHVTMESSESDKSQTISVKVDETGQGEAVFVVSRWPEDEKVAIKIAPHTDLSGIEVLSTDYVNDWTPASLDDIPDFTSVNLGYCTAPKVNFSNMNFSRSNMEGGIFLDAKFTGANLSQVRFHGAMLKGADLRFTDLSGADLSNADLSDAKLLVSNLTGVNWKGVNLSGAVIATGISDGALYDKYDFYQAAKELKLTEKQIEFLITSKAIEVRDNQTLDIVEEGFDPEKHHIPAWVIQNWEAQTNNEDPRLNEPA